MLGIAQFLDSILNVLESALQSFINRLPPDPKSLKDSVSYSLLSPGKRIRPQLVLASKELFEIEQDLEQIAVAIEAVHCFSLVHDDLPCMDNDDFRRGKPSNHKVFGEATALLAGDALIGLALEEFIEGSQSFSSANRTLALKFFLKSIGPSGLIGGQAMEFQKDSTLNLQSLLYLFELKTGALFQAAILTPAILAGKTGTVEYNHLESYARNFSIAFQLRDDLEDEGSPKERPETHILHHLSREKACLLFKKHYDAARAVLETHFPLMRGNAHSQILAQLDLPSTLC